MVLLLNNSTLHIPCFEKDMKFDSCGTEFLLLFIQKSVSHQKSEESQIPYIYTWEFVSHSLIYS